MLVVKYKCINVMFQSDFVIDVQITESQNNIKYTRVIEYFALKF